MIIFDHLNKRFGRIQAVDDLSFEIKTGEIFGLLGPNGAGKTTTVNLAVGLTAPDSGMVTVDDDSPTKPSVRSRIGVATQALALYEELTGKENLVFFGKMQGLRGEKLQERVAWALDFVSLDSRKKDRVKTYSGGMKRRLNLAVAVIHDPEIIFMDEPTVGVDPQSRNAIFDHTRELNRQGRTVIYITHYMEEAQQLCHRVGIIDNGKLHALGAVDDLLSTHGGGTTVRATCNGTSKTVETDDPVSTLQEWQKQGSLTHIRVDTPNLERVFLNLTGRSLRD